MKKDELFFLGLKAIIQNRNKKILLLKSSKGYWDLPGGRIQENEQPLETLLREVAEETGITDLTNIQPDVMTLTSIKVPTLEGGPYSLILWYHTCTLSKETPINLSHEHTDYTWASAEEVKKLICIPENLAPDIFQ